MSRPAKRIPKRIRVRAPERTPAVTPLPPEAVSRLNKVPAERFVPPIVLHSEAGARSPAPAFPMRPCRRCRTFTTLLQCPHCREASRLVRVFLDDERPCPAGWVPARWPLEVIHLLALGAVSHLSLDHDLGDDERGTGYDVLLWLEEAVATRGVTPPAIAVHSANASARRKMLAAAAKIARLAARA